MRFIFGVIVGIVLTVGAALLHDNNVPPDNTPPRSAQQLANQPIVDWDVLSVVVQNEMAFVGSWWDSLLGRAGNQRRQP